jgi:hypothetical protein
MHYRVKDIHGVVHYADKVWMPEVHGHLFAAWCDLGQEKSTPPPEECWTMSATPRNQAVTCFFCLHLRHGARRG